MNCDGGDFESSPFGFGLYVRVYRITAPVRRGFMCGIRRNFLILPLLVALLGCNEGPASVRLAASRVRVAFSTQQVGVVSTATRVGLTVDRGSVRPDQQSFVFGQGTAEFAVSVPTGLIAFSANVYSNSEVVLYSGTTTQNITADNFTVDLPLLPVNAVMVVFPDTASLLTTASSFSIRNVGVQPLTWQMEPPCDATTCLTLSKNTGTLAPGASDVVNVTGWAAAQQQLNALRITSNVGHIDLRVVTPVDNTPPTITLAGIPASSINPQQRVWTFSAQDPGVNMSGLAVNPFRVRLRRARPTGDVCFVPANTFTGVMTPCLLNNSPNFQVDDGMVGVDASGNREGYWELIGFAVDRAGNASQQLTGLTLLDVTAPAISSVSFPPVLSGNGNHTFLVNEADNVDLRRRLAAIAYVGALNLFVGSRTLGTFGIADGVLGTLADTFTVAGFIRAIEGTATNNRANGNPSQAQSALISVQDVAANQASVTTDIRSAVVAPSGQPIPSLRTINPAVFFPPVATHGAFIHLTPTAVNVCRSASGCVNPNTTSLRATFNGASATLTNPFQRVAFYYFDSSATRWVLIGSTAAPTVTDLLGTRTLTYTVAWNVTGLTTIDGQPLTGATSVMAVGVHASGSALNASATQRIVNVFNN